MGAAVDKFRDDFRDRSSRSMAFDFEPEWPQNQKHKNRRRGVRPIEASTLQYVHLRREAHPRVPTLSWVDERPHRTWSEQVATKCACCQGPSRGQRVRAAALAGRPGSLDECSQRCRGGHTHGTIRLIMRCYLIAETLIVHY